MYVQIRRQYYVAANMLTIIIIEFASIFLFLDYSIECIAMKYIFFSSSRRIRKENVKKKRGNRLAFVSYIWGYF